MKKRCLSMLLALMMALSLTVVPAGASSGQCGDNVTWNFDQNTGTLTISGEGTIEYYVRIPFMPWGEYYNDIKSIIIEDGVAFDGGYAFSELHEVTQMTIGNGCSSIPDSMTCNLESLRTLHISNSVKSIGAEAFYGSYELTDIYYDGTEAQWNSISIDPNNAELFGATLHFKDSSPTSSAFSDVADTAWYAADVADIQKYGLINGHPDGTFRPQEKLTLAQAITLAARIHAQLNNNGDIKNGSPWYQPYVDYADANGICQTGEFGSDYNAECSRLAMAVLFQRAFPTDTERVLNNVTTLPDVEDEGYGSSVFYLYRQGVLTGNDSQGTFKPDKGVSRAEASAILNRIMDAEKRKSFTLEESEAPANQPSPDDFSDEELLAMANQLLDEYYCTPALEKYNFAAYLAAGAVFEQDWDNERIDENGVYWTRVIDPEIRTMEDIRDAWYSRFARSSVMPEKMLDMYKEMDGAVWSSCGGVGDNFTLIQMREVTERDGKRAVLTGDEIFTGLWWESEDEWEVTGTITYTMVWEDGEWRCQEIALDGRPWGFALFEEDY